MISDEIEFTQEEEDKKKKKKNYVLPEGITILIHENGVLKIGNKEDFLENEWQYRVSDKTEKYMLIDSDKEKAAPLVKSILNDLDLFPELRMLQVVQYLLYLIIFLCLIIPGYIGYFGAKTEKLDSIQKSFTELKASFEQKQKTTSVEASSGIFKSKVQGVQKSE